MIYCNHYDTDQSDFKLFLINIHLLIYVFCLCILSILFILDSNPLIDPSISSLIRGFAKDLT